MTIKAPKRSSNGIMVRSGSVQAPEQFLSASHIDMNDFTLELMDGLLSLLQTQGVGVNRTRQKRLLICQLEPKEGVFVTFHVLTALYRVTQ